MNHKELEALSSLQLQQLIADAAAVLAARCSTTLPKSSGLFTFGNESSTLTGGASSGGASLFGLPSSGGTSLFGPPPRGLSEGSIFSFGGSSAATSSSSGAGVASGKLFGGTGSGLFEGACALASAQATAPSDSIVAAKATGDAVAEAVRGVGGCNSEDDDAHLKDELLVINGWTPSMTLEILDNVATGEEGEEQLYSQRSKLYRFRDDEWKERGLGAAKLLKNKADGRVRFLLRQEKTGKVVANFFVVNRDPYCDLRPNADSEKILCWSAQDWSEGQLEVERFALKFGTVELAQSFKEAFSEAKTQNDAALAEQLRKA